ncbi:hypothetical protein [Spirosoma flavum]|uniref:WYL domain-containing protein n=1 Tax=Spirosoma flavum TaxID=2048557 RepID=A0ABW6AQ23_9BACT
MRIEGIRFHYQIKQVRSAFAKMDCQDTDQLMTTYQLSFAFLKQLLKVGLLSLSNGVYCKGERWTYEPDMSLEKFLAISRSNSVESVAEQLIKPTIKNRQLVLDIPVIQPSLEQALKPRRNLVMNLTFTGRNESGVISWYSRHASKVIDSDKQEVLEVKGKIYRVIDLEEHLGKALLDFFEGSLQLTVRRRSKKDRTY